jgi:hypothetical protein
VIGGAAKDVQRAQTTYFSLFNPPAEVANTNESIVQHEMTVGGTLSQLRIRLEANNAPASSSHTFVVRRNGVDTAVTCQIGSGSSSCSNSTSTAAFAAGDLISISAVPSGNPTDNLDVRWTAKYAQP